MPGPNILLLHLPFQDLATVSERLGGGAPYEPQLVIPLGLMYISSFFKKEHPEARVFMADFEYRLKRVHACRSIADWARDGLAEVPFTPDLIGVSLNFSLSWPYFETLVPLCKELWPGVPVVVGGVHATNTTRFILENTAADYVFRGEGEEAFSLVVDQHLRGETPCCPGLYSRDTLVPDPELVLAAPIQDLDALPFPDWDIVRAEEYVTAASNMQCWLLPPSGKRVALFLTSRGCPHQCTFCSARTVHGRKVRFRSVENVLAEMRQLYERHGTTLFIPFDDMFTANRARLLALLQALQALNIPGLELQFPNGLNVNTTDPEIIDRLMDCGTRVFNFAIESGSPHVQKHLIRKNCDLDRAKALIRHCRERGAMTVCYFIFGFPRETAEMLAETTAYIRELEADWANHQCAVPLVGTEVYREFVEMGAIRENDPALWSNSFFFERAFDSPAMSAAELKAIVRRSDSAANYVFNPNLRYGNLDRAEAMFTTMFHAHPHHVMALYGLFLVRQARGDQAGAGEMFRRMRRMAALDQEAWSRFEDMRDLFVPEIAGTDLFQAEPLRNVFVLRDQGRHAEALDLLDLLMAEDPEYLELTRTKGGILAHRGDHAAALACFRAVLDRDPGRLDVKLNMVDTLRYAGRLQEALDLCADIAASRPDFPDLDRKRNQVLEARDASRDAGAGA